jgi:hypothetical protein
MPPAFLARHLAAMTAGPLGVPVVFGTKRTTGFLDTHDVEMMDGSDALVRRRVTVLTMPTAALPTLAEGSAITVDGAAYLVRIIDYLDDGAVAQYRLVPASP